ncbi:MAG: hypothetical protein PHE67_03615 [Campylobacterales bacterium]|nr:hypothetical protein [Campylobacterales bacterium]
MSRTMKRETVKRAAKAVISFIVLSVFGYWAFVDYMNGGRSSELGVAITSWCLALFFVWVFIFKREEWLKEKLNDYF